MYAVQDVPDMPDLDELRAIALKRREHFSGLIKMAQVELDKANATLERLGTGKTRPVKKDAKIYAHRDQYERMMEALGNADKPMTLDDLAAATGEHKSSMSACTRLALQQGHAERTCRNRFYYFTITDEGLDALTSKPELRLRAGVGVIR